MLGNSVRGAHLVLGPAGSGKTTLLRERYVELVRAGEVGILFLVHTRAAARALRERILRDSGRSTDQVRVSTWHQFGLGLLRDHYAGLGYRREPALLTGPEQFGLVRDLIREPGEQERWSAFPKQRHLSGFVEELREFVLRAQDALESPERLEALARERGRADLEEAARFFRRYLDRLDARDDAVVDHANVIARAWQLLTERADIAERLRAEDTRHVLVDDLQNVTPAQEALLRELVVPGGSVVVAADPDARIFGFRGASPDVIESFKRTFRPVTDHALAEQHRGVPQTDAWVFDHLTEEADAIARECIRMHARADTMWGEIAILLRRFGPPARAIRRALERAGVPFVVVGEDRPLVAEPAVRPMLDLVRVALTAGEDDDLLLGLLASPIVGLDPYEVRGLRRDAHLRRRSLGSFVAAPPEDLPEQTAAKLGRLRSLLDAVRDREARRERPDQVFWFLWSELEYFRDLVAREDADALDAIEAFARAITRFSDRRSGKTFGEYLQVLEGVEFGPEPWSVPEERRPDAVRVMTAHTAAGEEFDAVIVAGCVEGEFPDPNERPRMFDVRELLAPATPFERRLARFDEERRLFRVAVTRARRRLLVTAAHESSQREPLVPSPLVHMAGVEWTRRPDVAMEPLSRDEAEAEARRALRAGTPEQKQEALALLARLPGVDPDAWWYERDWTDPGIPIAPEELQTSYSRLSDYDNCALQYLYRQELGLAPEPSHQMLLGSWIHDIIDLCARGEVAATEDALIGALDARWDPNVFESIAVEHRRRLDAEEMLRRWINIDAKFETLASETKFEFPIDGAVMRGRIDRVVRFGRSMARLIDYKTGRDAKRNEEAEEDLQLASYYLALKRVPELRSLGEPKYLELVYLGAFAKAGGYMRAGVDPTTIPDFEQKAQERLESFVAGIKAERFAPTPNANCRWCSFKTLCPVWAEGDEVAL